MLLILLSAFLFYLSFPNILHLHGFWFLAWGFAVPLLASLERQTLRERLRRGLIFGVLGYGLLVQWLVPVHVIGFVIFVLALSIQTVIFAACCVEVRGKAWKLFLIPSAWAVSEFLRTRLLDGFCWVLGYSQAFHPVMVQSAAFAGPYAVSFIVMFVNVCLYFAWKEKPLRGVYTLAAVFVLAGNAGLGWWAMETSVPAPDVSGLQVCAIQANIPPERKLSEAYFDDNVNIHVGLTQQGVIDGYPELVLWPETAFPDDLLQDRRWMERLKQLAVNTQTSFLLGAALTQGDDYFNSAVLIDPRGDLKGIYDKQALVPFSERPPLEKFWPALSRRLRTGKFEFAAGHGLGLFDFTRGKFASAEKLTRFGVVICSEECYPRLFNGLQAGGATFVVAMLNDGWFRERAALMMHAQNAVFRAVEFRRPVVRVANTGLTCMVNSDGAIDWKAALPLERPGYRIFRIQGSHRPSVYAQIGDIFAVLCAVFVIINIGMALWEENE